MSNSHITTKTINFQLPVRKFFEDTLDYNTFVERYMEQYTLPPMTETDEEYKKRCEEAWTKLIKHTNKRSHNVQNYIEFDEYDDYNDDADETILSDEICEWVEAFTETSKDREYAQIKENEYQRVRKEQQAISAARDAAILQENLSILLKKSEEMKAQHQREAEELEARIKKLVV